MSGTPVSECTHCHICQEGCHFLKKYGIDIGDTDRLKELAYHCFLCGKCTEVCPIGIDGRAEVMRLRQERTDSGERSSIESTYSGLLREKKDYIFRNYSGASAGSVFFPGCNFPSLFPKTAKTVSGLLLKEAGISTVYDCCGKPVGELGLTDYETSIFAGLEVRIQKYGITELVTACPNCLYYMKGRVSVPVVNIYRKLRELGLGNPVDMDVVLFLPCPDRYAKEWVDDIRYFVKGDIRCIDDIQCCGLGGSAAVKEPEIAKGFTAELKEEFAGSLRTYCASCAGRIRRNGYKDIRHILSDVLGMKESPDTMKSYVNRMMTKRRR